MDQNQVDLETPNLGLVSISKKVIDFFVEETDGSIETATQAASDILMSKEIEELVPPLALPGPKKLEFWVDHCSSTVFTVHIKNDFKIVSMAIKQDVF